MKKYYTPSIEEFHVGFEFESQYLKDLDAWVKESISILNASHFFESYIRDASPTEFRVKYLDREDIEELGFDNYQPPYEYDHTWHYKGSKDPKLKVWFNNPIPVVRIYSSFPAIIFQGKIKNKSELKRLLIQLRILNED